MAIDYSDMIARARRDQPEHAAAKSAIVLHADASKKKKRKKKRTKKQIAATAANFAKRRGKKPIKRKKGKRKSVLAKGRSATGLTKRRKRASLKKPQAAREGKATQPTSKRNPRMATTTVAKALTRARSPKRKAALRRLADKYGPNHRVELAGGKKKKRKKAKKSAGKRPRPKSKKRKSARRSAPKRRTTKLARTVRRAKRRRRVVARGKHGKFTTITKRAATKRRKRGQRIAMIVAESPRRRRGRRGHRRFRGALDNPMTGMELGVGIFSALVGLVVLDIADRFVAARSGPLAGTAYATQAPLSLARAGMGVGVAAVPLIAAHFIKIPVLRSALQFFGVGAGLNLAGKVVNMGIGRLGRDKPDTSLYSRLYKPEVLQSQMQKQIAAQTAAQGGAKTGAAGLPADKTKALNDAGLGQTMVHAAETLRAHAPAMRALNAHADAIRAVKAGRATPAQAATVAQITQTFGESIKAINSHPKEMLDKAVATYGAKQLGLAGPPPDMNVDLVPTHAALPTPAKSSGGWAMQDDQ